MYEKEQIKQLRTTTNERYEREKKNVKEGTRKSEWNKKQRMRKNERLTMETIEHTKRNEPESTNYWITFLGDATVIISRFEGCHKESKN